jgi:Phospholipid methyltransferase
LGVEKTTCLVRSGAYRIIRHPLYASLLALAWGAFLKAPSWLGLVLAAVATGAIYLAARAEEQENLSYPDATCGGINDDPMLGPLQDNGGPTWTMALGTGSAALGAADDDLCAADPVNNLDQRGVTRPQGVHCDIGAYEKGVLKVYLPLVVR